MRHRVAGRHLGRTSGHRLAMRRNLVASLFEHETVLTTVEKAKEVKPFAEKLITLARKGTLAARRRAIALLGNRDIIEYEDGKAVKKGTVVGKLFSDLGPRYVERPGGYVRIIRLSLRRLGDNGQLVQLQLLGEQETLQKESKSARPKKRSRRRSRKKAEVETVVEAKEVADREQGASAVETGDAQQTGGSGEAKAAVEPEKVAPADETEDRAGEGEKQK